MYSTFMTSLSIVSVTLLEDPMDVDILSPAPAVLTCTASGEPTPQFTWTKVFPSGTTVEVSESMANIAISTILSGGNVTSTLTIEPTDAFDTANYSCTAENTFGPVTSSEAEVTVFGKIFNFQFGRIVKNFLGYTFLAGFITSFFTSQLLL